MRIAIHADAQGARVSAARLVRAQEAASSLLPVEANIHDAMTRSVAREFDAGGPTAGGWRPVSPRWLEYKRRHGLDNRTMHATRHLRHSLTREDDPGHVWHARPRELTLSTMIDYANYAHRQRPVLLSRAARAWIRDIYAEHVRRAVSGE